MSADIDPSLRAAEPPKDDLADGFSPPPPQPTREPGRGADAAPPEPVLGPKSAF